MLVKEMRRCQSHGLKIGIIPPYRGGELLSWIEMSKSGSYANRPRYSEASESEVSAAGLHVSIRSDTTQCVNTFERTEEFDNSLAGLKDKKGRARIALRIRSAEHGNFGDCEPVGEGVFEVRVHFGPGYRVYYTRRAKVVYVLVCEESRHQTCY